MDLQDDDSLVAAVNHVLGAHRDDQHYRNWTRALVEHISTVQQADESEFRSESFQRNMWDSEAISATGQGFISTRAFWSDVAIVNRLWEVRNLSVALDKSAFTMELQRLWNELVDQIKQQGSRVPRLKLARVFAALQPRHFTSLADGKVLDNLGKRMGVGNLRDGRALLNQRILDRIDSIWSRIEFLQDEPLDLVRMKLPWLLFKRDRIQTDDEVTIDTGEVAGQGQLRPLPAERRRRGMLAIGGSIPSVLAMLQFVKDGCSREDFREHVRAVNPKLSPSSVNTNINALIAEWGVLAADNDRMTLTSRGMAFLESGDPDDVSDWLLTQILGLDNLLILLGKGPREQKTLITDLQQVNPGWKTNFAPTALLGWLRAMELVEATADKKLALTSRGREWTERIHWAPGVLTATRTPSEEGSPEQEFPLRALVRPSVDQIMAMFPDTLVFGRALVAQLDAALWSHERRHFVVLSGLSGSGKTQLARSYGHALRGQSTSATSDGVYVLPVQPGWHDPSPLLGYVNPLNTERYVRTSFLNFLLDAVRDPERPYTVVLDEMNLSHPEQYLAPLLSAMETGDQIDLHAQDEDVDEIPSSVAYPSNLLIVGTVNMDETTHGLSDKVLDRASVIEFWEINTDAYPGWESSGLDPAHVVNLQRVMKQLCAALRPARLHFGWRTIGDVIGYVRAALAGGVIEFWPAVDHAIYSKILPKLRGEDSQRFRTALAETKMLLADYKLPMAQDKVTQLYDDLSRLGSARFWR
ncbi:McrB family protein [Achromobacter insolitus]|uniref:McrB family protein n=1 Tax=Achromobacter insolitus TaxID=217204 RepID=UPI00174ADB9B|nr:hypothetical protein [Achromobacter insolitus]